MDLHQQLHTLHMRARLSTLWIFVLLNMLFRDIHEMPDLIQQIVTGTFSTTQITAELMLVAGIVLEILIVMTILSRLLPYRLNRWMNVIVGGLSILLILSFGTNDLDDIWFMAMEIIGLVAIIWSAWRWRELPSGSTLSIDTPQTKINLEQANVRN